MRIRGPFHRGRQPGGLPGSPASPARFAVVALLALSVACGDADDEGPDARAADRADSPELTRQEARDAAAVRDFRLTMDRVRGFAAATENVMRRGTEDRAFRDRVESVMEDAEDQESLDDVVRRLEGDRDWRREMERAGISTRDYVMTAMALTSVGTYAAMREMGFEGERSEWVSDRNLAFFEENREEIERVMQRVQQMDQELFGDDDDW